MNRSATYLYGFARSGTEVSATLRGIEEAGPVWVHEVAGLAALVSEVPVEPFESQSSSDLSWLIPRAVRHERVIEAMHVLGPVLPVRFGSLFTNRSALETWADANREVIERFLQQVADKDEWALKVDVDLGHALESLAAVDPDWAARASGLPASPGARYLREKRLRETARQQVRKAAAEAVTRLRTAARALADERVLATRKPETADLEPILHAVYLVPRHAISEFHHRTGLAIGDLACLRLETTGPWPPSHFCPPMGPSGP